jgi:hypothetical protein
MQHPPGRRPSHNGHFLNDASISGIEGNAEIAVSDEQSLGSSYGVSLRISDFTLDIPL